MLYSGTHLVIWNLTASSASCNTNSITGTNSHSGTQDGSFKASHNPVGAVRVSKVGKNKFSQKNSFSPKVAYLENNQYTKWLTEKSGNNYNVEQYISCTS